MRSGTPQSLSPCLRKPKSRWSCTQTKLFFSAQFLPSPQADKPKQSVSRSTENSLTGATPTKSFESEKSEAIATCAAGAIFAGDFLGRRNGFCKGKIQILVIILHMIPLNLSGKDKEVIYVAWAAVVKMSRATFCYLFHRVIDPPIRVYINDCQSQTHYQHP